MIGVQVGTLEGKYLGIPFSVGRAKKSVFNDIKDRIWKKLSGWKERFLSPAGKEVLIKSVVQAIPTYTMQCFKLPNAVCDDILKMIRNFLWRQKKDERRICWLSWTELYKPKSEGGMGFRNLPCFNQALLAKQGWRLISQPTSLLTQILKAKYYPDGDFMAATIGNRPSYLWQLATWERSFEKEMEEACPEMQQFLRRPEDVPREVLAKVDTTFIHTMGVVGRARVPGLGNLSQEYILSTTSFSLTRVSDPRVEELTQHISHLTNENDQLKEQLSDMKQMWEEQRRIDAEREARRDQREAERDAQFRVLMDLVKGSHRQSS